MSRPDWSEAEKEFCRRLIVDEGLGVKVVLAKYREAFRGTERENLSTSGMLGKARRSGWEWRKNHSGTKQRRSTKIAKPTRTQDAIDKAFIGTGSISFLDAADRACCWPFGHGLQTTYCGADTVRDPDKPFKRFPYCAAHQMLACK